MRGGLRANIVVLPPTEIVDPFAAEFKAYNGAIKTQNDIRAIRRSLVHWYERVRRDLPWRRTTDPYRIWLSEIMLQQTRVVAAIPYYERFLARFPTVNALAAAATDDVLACWSGLGYYSRARNLHRAAQLVAGNGGFPHEYDAIRALPGIGDYTAAAIASIAFGLPHAAVDGNAIRVMARLTGERGDIGSAKTRQRLAEAAALLLDRKRPGVFNQAVMELGATVCLSHSPQCAECPVLACCEARALGLASELPVKAARTTYHDVSLTLLLIERNGRVLLRKRDGASARMAGFWELPELADIPAAVPGETAATLRHTITNHRYTIEIIRATLPGAARNGLTWFRHDELDSIPLATVTRKAIRKAERH